MCFEFLSSVSLLDEEMGGVWPLNSSPSCRVKPCPHPPSTHPPSGPDAPSHHLQSLSNIACTLCNKVALGSVECVAMIKSPSASGDLEGGSRRQSASTRKVTGRLLAAPPCLLSMPPTLPLPRGQPPPPRSSLLRGLVKPPCTSCTSYNSRAQTTSSNYLQSSH